MCGIFGFVGTEQDVSALMYNRLRQLEYRGYDSWGIAASRDGKVVSMKQTGKLGERAPEPIFATLALGHTRWATTGPVTRVNAHPHMDCSGELAVVHNGIVENYVPLRAALLEAGHRFLSDTDTEVIAHLIEEEIQRGAKTLADALRETAKKLHGLNAIAVMSTLTGELAATKNGSPLYAAVGPKGAYLSSDISAFSSLAEEVLRLKEGEIVELRAGDLRLTSVKSGQIVPAELEPVPPEFQEATVGKFNHFLEKEIYEQAPLIRRYAEEKNDKVQALRDAVSCAQTCVLTGCGSAYHAALLGSYFAADRAHTNVRVIYPHELEHFQSSLRPNDLLLCLSQSGETIDVLDALRVARHCSMNTAALVNVPTSTLAAAADQICTLDAGPEISVLSTKAFLAMLARLASLFSPSISETTEAFAEASSEIEKVLTPEYRKKIKRLADTLKDSKSMFVVGAGVCYPLALEAALKIKEVSYIHAEGFAAAELKHGVISLIEKDTPCVVLIPPGGKAARMRVSADELKARGARLIGVGPEDEVFDDSLPISATSDLSYSLAAIVPLQLLAYELALVRKLDPDKPRNLAKSVTVR